MLTKKRVTPTDQSPTLQGNDQQTTEKRFVLQAFNSFKYMIYDLCSATWTTAHLNRSRREKKKRRQELGRRLSLAKQNKRLQQNEEIHQETPTSPTTVTPYTTRSSTRRPQQNLQSLLAAIKKTPAKAHLSRSLRSLTRAVDQQTVTEPSSEQTTQDGGIVALSHPGNSEGLIGSSPVMSVANQSCDAGHENEALLQFVRATQSMASQLADSSDELNVQKLELAKNSTLVQISLFKLIKTDQNDTNGNQSGPNIDQAGQDSNQPGQSSTTVDQRTITVDQDQNSTTVDQGDQNSTRIDQIPAQQAQHILSHLFSIVTSQLDDGNNPVASIPTDSTDITLDSIINPVSFDQSDIPVGVEESSEASLKSANEMMCVMFLYSVCYIVV